MKALTLTQPWATLVAIGAKKIETRSWPTNYRGPLAIHAAKRFPEEAQHLCFREPFRKILIAQYSFMQQGEIYLGKHKFPLGYVIAIGELVQCVQITETIQEFINFDPKIFGKLLVVSPGDKTTIIIPPVGDEYYFGDYTPGRFAWILANIELLPEPILAKGKLGLWEWDDTHS